MKKLILIMGHLAAGKSTFARKLGEKLNALTLIKDDIKEILGDNIGFNNRQENLKLSYATFDIMKYTLAQSVDALDILILESNFRKHEVKVLNDIAKANGIEVINFVLSAEPELLLERYQNRDKDRHVVHTSVGYADPKKFKDNLTDFTTYHLFDRVINIDTSDFSSIDIEYYANIINS